MPCPLNGEFPHEHIEQWNKTDRPIIRGSGYPVIGCYISGYDSGFTCTHCGTFDRDSKYIMDQWFSELNKKLNLKAQVVE